jgi:thiamine-phosphate pyrophosphorylase
MKNLDLRLYALIDPANCGGHNPAELAGVLARGGASLIQLRDKSGETRKMVALARAVKNALKGSGVPLLINDRVDVALASGADGVHLGQSDMEAADARTILGPDAIIGITVRTEPEARAADLEASDYVGLGGVFATSSKKNETPPIGIDGLEHLAGLIRGRRTGMPLVAIAGIDASNAGSAIGAGVDGVAVISALSAAGDPEMAARELRAIVDAARRERISA